MGVQHLCRMLENPAQSIPFPFPHLNQCQKAVDLDSRECGCYAASRKYVLYRTYILGIDRSAVRTDSKVSG
jgi:hypothetical protein